MGNQALARTFIQEVLSKGQLEKMECFIDPENEPEDNLSMADGLAALSKTLSSEKQVRNYDKIHRVFAKGNLALSVCEGSRDGAHSSFYDLFRIAKGKIVELWDTTEEIPPRSQ